MKIVPRLDRIFIGCLTTAACLAYVDRTIAFVLVLVALGVGIARTIIVYNDFKRRGL